MSSIKKTEGMILPFLMAILSLILILFLGILQEINKTRIYLKTEIATQQIFTQLHLLSLDLPNYFLSHAMDCVHELHSAVWYKDPSHWSNQLVCSWQRGAYHYELQAAFIGHADCLLWQNRPVKLYEIVVRNLPSELMRAYIIAVPEDDAIGKCHEATKKLHSRVMQEYAW